MALRWCSGANEWTEFLQRVSQCPKRVSFLSRCKLRSLREATHLIDDRYNNSTPVILYMFLFISITGERKHLRGNYHQNTHPAEHLQWVTASSALLVLHSLEARSIRHTYALLLFSMLSNILSTT